MRLAVVAAISLAAASGACTRHHHIATLQAGKTVTVETTDGAAVEATVVPHATEIVLADTTGRVVQTQHIAQVVDVRRGRGALDGALIGGLTGIAFGAVLGFAEGDDQCGDICILRFSAEDKAALLGGMLGIVGGGAGAIVGAIAGSRDVYVFGDSREVRITPNGPRGSVAGVTFEF
jgi:hypothetical protein